MGKARTLAGTVSTGGPLADGAIAAAEVSGLSTVATSGSYSDLSNKPSTLVSGTAITTSGLAEYEFTGLPSGIRQVKLMLRNVSANLLSTGAIQLQLGTASSYLTSGYTFTGTSIDSSTITHNTGGGTAWQLIWTNNDANQYTGVMELLRITDNIWLHRMQMRVSTTRVLFSVGEVDLGGTLTRIKAFMGVGTFDGGTMNIHYE